jgi:DNA-nicking Smr family endonuclease
MGKRGQDHETDVELWARVAGSARPLHKRPTVRKVDLPKPAPKAETKERPPTVKPALKPTPKPAPTPRGEALDRGTARKLERGHLAVEARLDLHGMKQREAHAALRRFLKSAQGKGYRQGYSGEYAAKLLRRGRARRTAPGRAALARGT